MVSWRNRRPAPLSSLDATTLRKIEAMRDRIMCGIGAEEPWVVERGGIAMHFRRPLRIEEVNLLPADNPDVRARQGRA